MGLLGSAYDTDRGIRNGTADPFKSAKGVIIHPILQHKHYHFDHFQLFSWFRTAEGSVSKRCDKMKAGASEVTHRLWFIPVMFFS